MSSNRTFSTLEDLETSANIRPLRLALTDGANNLRTSNPSHNYPHRQLSLYNNRTFTTLEDLETSANIRPLRLALTDGANNLRTSNPSHNCPHRQLSLYNNMRQSMNNLFRTERTVNFEESGSDEALRRNEQILDAYFDELQRYFNEQREEVKRELRNLTPEQQKDVLTFWNGVQEFFKVALTWLKDMFAAVLDHIHQGFRIVKKVVDEIFQSIGDWFYWWSNVFETESLSRVN